MPFRGCYVKLLSLMFIFVLIYFYWRTCCPTNEFSENHKKSISIFLRMPSDSRLHRTRFHCCFLRTVVLFWPSDLGHIVVVLDEESRSENAAFIKEIQHQLKQFPDFNLMVKYESLPKKKDVLDFPGSLKPPNYNRQLWSSFLIDLYTEADVIAWMDNDAAFATPVTQSTIFHEGRLRAFGEAWCTFEKYPWIEGWYSTTEKALGLPMLADFMVYFPVYIYRDTFTQCRKYILSRFNTTDFEEAFKRFYHSGTSYVSPVSVILSYAWHFERELYDWNLKLNCDLETYNRRFPTGDKIQPNDMRGFFSAPQTAFHAHGRDLSSPTYHPFPVSIIRIASFCLMHAAFGNKLPEKCIIFNEMPALEDMLMLFNHDMHGIRIEKDQTFCIGEMRNYCFEGLKKYIKEFGDELQMYKRKLPDWQDFETVAATAQHIGITCPPGSP